MVRPVSCVVSHELLLSYTGSASGKVFGGGDFQKSARVFHGGFHTSVNVSWLWLVSCMCV